MPEKNGARMIAEGAAIAALYVVLTMVANAFGLANYAIQVRFSEALCILPLFTPSAIWGLFAGCILANTLTGCLPLDTLFGSLATLSGALALGMMARRMHLSPHSKMTCLLAPLPNVIANTIVVPLILTYVYRFEGSLPYFFVTVGAGEIISCYGFGVPLLLWVARNQGFLFQKNTF